MRSVDPQPRSRPSKTGSVQLNVGRLLELRMAVFESMSDWLTFLRRVEAVMGDARGQLVVCVDYRHLQALSPTLAQPILDALRNTSSRVVRNAVLVPLNAPVLRMQMDRLQLGASSGTRRICADAAEAKAWLSSHLNKPEMNRLDEFLAQGE